MCEIGERGDRMYHVAVCENDLDMLDHARCLCHEILGDAEVDHDISLFTSAETLESTLKEKNDPFQLIIMDIKLGEKDGLTLAKEIYSRNADIGIVFITNYPEFAAEGYDAHPIHFLTKPIDKMRLTEAIKIDLKRKALPKTVTINYGRKVAVYPIREIYYIESRNHHIHIKTANGFDEIRLSLSEVELMLSCQFQRCHASYLVNLEYVKKVGKTEIVLKDDTKLPVSRSYSNRFVTAYLRYFNTYLS